jgi:hypothetical protein
MILISLKLAKDLKESGLKWQPELHDFFTIPGSDLESRIFVVSDMMIDIQQLFGHHMITFNGAVEWSLDYIMITEAVWMPRDSQLREILMTQLKDGKNPNLKLFSRPEATICRMSYQGRAQSFEAKNGSDAYGKALRFLLSKRNDSYIEA